MAQFYDFFGMRALVKSGTRMRRVGWRTKWVSYWRGLWFIEPTSDPKTPEVITAGPLRVVEAADWSAAEFRARDWTAAEVDREADPDPAPVIISFVANPATIAAGASSLLTWSVTGATQILINGTDVSGLSALAVSPVAPSIFTLTAINSTSSVSANVTVYIQSSPLAPTPPSNPPPLPPGIRPPGLGGGAKGGGQTTGSGTPGGGGGTSSGGGFPNNNGGGGGPSGGPGGGSGDGGPGGGSGDGGSSDEGNPPPPPEWRPADFDLSVVVSCDDDGSTKVICDLTASGVRDDDGYQVSIRFGSETETGNIFADSDVVHAEFTALDDVEVGATLTATAHVYNVALGRGWSTTVSGSDTKPSECNACSDDVYKAGTGNSDETYLLNAGMWPLAAGKEARWEWSVGMDHVPSDGSGSVQLKITALPSNAVLLDSTCLFGGTGGGFTIPEDTVAVKYELTADCDGYTGSGTTWEYDGGCLIQDAPAP